MNLNFIYGLLLKFKFCLFQDHDMCFVSIDIFISLESINFI